MLVLVRDLFTTNAIRNITEILGDTVFKNRVVSGLVDQY